jgi:multidrug efflux pump subunit AcrB
LRLAPKDGAVPVHAAHDEGVLGRIYRRIATPIVRSKRSSWIFLIGVGIATLLSMTLFATKAVTVKLLPFDNKSEIAVVVDLPEGASLEDTERTLFVAADIAHGLPEITSVQSYAGTPAPFNFNGLVRHYYLRERPELGELQVNLAARAGAVRFKPILLTALAAMIGAATILLDPIFQGLAISLLFGLASSTLLTVLVIPAIYIALRQPSPQTPASK